MALMITDKIMAELDGAECVVYDTAGFLYAWFGGDSHGVHCYDGAGNECDYFTIGTRAGEQLTVREVRESINRHIAASHDEA